MLKGSFSHLANRWTARIIDSLEKQSMSCLSLILDLTVPAYEFVESVLPTVHSNDLSALLNEARDNGRSDAGDYTSCENKLT